MDFDQITQVVQAAARSPIAKSISRFLLDWKLDQRTLLYIAIALAIGFLIGRRRASRTIRSARTEVFQNHGEASLTQILKSSFGPPDYHLMNHVTLQMSDGTTQIDHILVSRFGVFVIETKDYNEGWIFASADQKQWAQVLYSWKFKFQNPLHQNFRHVCAVQALLDFLPSEAIKPAVVFTGRAEFKTAMPKGVFRPLGLMALVAEQTTEVMSHNRMQFCVGRLETARLAISRETDIEHVQNLERRHGNRS